MAFLSLFQTGWRDQLSLIYSWSKWVCNLSGISNYGILGLDLWIAIVSYSSTWKIFFCPLKLGWFLVQTSIFQNPSQSFQSEDTSLSDGSRWNINNGHKFLWNGVSFWEVFKPTYLQNSLQVFKLTKGLDKSWTHWFITANTFFPIIFYT